MRNNSPMFVFVDQAELDLEVARQAFATLGCEIITTVAALPMVIDQRMPYASHSALRKAQLAFMDIRHDLPIVTMERGLRVRAFHGLPGPGFNLVTATCGVEAISRQVDALGEDRSCTFEIALAYYDGHSELSERGPIDRGPTRMHFTRKLRGSIATVAQLEDAGVTAFKVEDLFVPEGFSCPFSSLPNERGFRLQRELESVYIDLADWLGEMDVERHRAAMRRIREGRLPVEEPAAIDDAPSERSSARTYPPVVVEDVPSSNVLDGEGSGGSAGSYRTVRDPQSSVARETVVRVGESNGRRRSASSMTQIGIAPVSFPRDE